MAYEAEGTGVYGPYFTAGAPVAGTDEVQTATFADTWAPGDTFRLRYEGAITGQVAWSATNGTLIGNIDTALEALATIGTGGVTTAVGTMTAGIGTATITFAGTNTAKKAHALIEVVDYTTAGDGSVAIAETTPGVTATRRSAPKGTLVIDTTNGVLYVKTGAAGTGTYVVAGAQT